jgi:hypothetical protein
MRTYEPISIPEEFWFDLDVLHVLSRRDVGALFCQISSVSGASQMRIGMAVGMEQNQVCRIMNADMRVRHLDVFERIADGLGMPDHARQALGLAPRTPPELPPDGGSGVEPTPLDGDGDRHGAMSVSEADSADLTQEEILAMTIRRARQFAVLNGQYLAPEAVEQLQDDTQHLATAYPQQPLVEILGDIAMTHDNIFRVLEHRHRPAESRHLYLLAGAVSGMLAKASHDMGDANGALTHARAGFLCAEHADHDGLRAWVKGLQSLIAYWAKRPNDSLRYAQDGTVFAKRSGSTTSVWLSVNEARAWAALGNAPAARAAIAQAEDASEQTRTDDLDHLGGICTFGRSRQLYYAADALALLPAEADAAEHYSTLALDAYGDPAAPDWSFSDQAGSAADLAVARILRNEIEGAAEALAPVLDLPPAQRINGIMASVERVQEALGEAPESEARDLLREEIEVFLRVPLAAIPR